MGEGGGGGAARKKFLGQVGLSGREKFPREGGGTGVAAWWRRRGVVHRGSGPLTYSIILRAEVGGGRAGRREFIGQA